LGTYLHDYGAGTVCQPERVFALDPIIAAELLMIGGNHWMVPLIGQKQSWGASLDAPHVTAAP
jgi:hypothetical protein